MLAKSGDSIARMKRKQKHPSNSSKGYYPDNARAEGLFETPKMKLCNRQQRPTLPSRETAS